MILETVLGATAAVIGLAADRENRKNSKIDKNRASDNKKTARPKRSGNG